ncbi:MAG: DUF58 domain-containing protein [Pseudomonadota bacterium]
MPSSRSERPNGGEAEGTAVSFERLVGLRQAAARRRKRVETGIAQVGGFAGRRRGMGLEIRDVRAFEDGDDMRYADPAVTARTGRLHVRTFHAEEDRAVLLLADFRRSMLWGTRRRLRSVAAAEALAAVGWQAVDAGAKVGLLVQRTGDMEFVSPREHWRAMIGICANLVRSHTLALEDAERGAGTMPPIGEALERASRLVPMGTRIVLASGLDGPPIAAAPSATELLHRHRLVVLKINDAVEHSPPTEALAYFGEDGVMGEGRFSPGLDDERERTEHLTRLGASIHSVNADQDFYELHRLEIV